MERKLRVEHSSAMWRRVGGGFYIKIIVPIGFHRNFRTGGDGPYNFGLYAFAKKLSWIPLAIFIAIV